MPQPVDYEQHHETLVDYLIAKIAIADWHGVSDAANDLRVLEAEQKGRQCHNLTI